ncbi:MAG: 3-phosphoshikimate 1-carboxyvinyltransferase [Gammaproteobacteria bacterium]|nr:3-phosphoshikimate 1-carboxyvinyltransferase [Gammaproteobacteria bacterium]
MNDPGLVRYTVNAGGALVGRLRVPGDKSISHRVVMLGALAAGDSHAGGFLHSEDTRATIAAFRRMGVTINAGDDGEIHIKGVGLRGLREPAAPLDLGNSGTSARLMTGLLAGQAFASDITGDASLRRRPMNRVVEPLRQMGAHIEMSAGGTLPLHIDGAPLKGIDYTLPVASAQLKSCLLLAGMYAGGDTVLHEPVATRDHTERMLAACGWPLERNTSGSLHISGGGELQPFSLEIPADISSAAFFLAGASMAPGSKVLLENVGVNPTRAAVIDILKMMGADIEITGQRELAGEPVADLQVRYASLQGIEIPEALVPISIDEFPAILIAAATAEGTTELRGAEELRVKESDRIQAMADGLNALGINAQVKAGGMVVHGGRLRGGRIDSHGDHRISMAFAMAALVADGPIVIDDCANVATSFPGFAGAARSLGLDIREETA